MYPRDDDVLSIVESLVFVKIGFPSNSVRSLTDPNCLMFAVVLLLSVVMMVFAYHDAAPRVASDTPLTLKFQASPPDADALGVPNPVQYPLKPDSW